MVQARYGVPYGTVPGLLFEKQQPVPALQQRLALHCTSRWVVRLAVPGSFSPPLAWTSRSAYHGASRWQVVRYPSMFGKDHPDSLAGNPPKVVELRGIEPLTSALRTQRSPS